MELVTLRLVIAGRVQGVSFRATMREVAIRCGVHGWVRNRADGSVEAILQGNETDVRRIVAWARKGPPGAIVSSIRQERLYWEARWADFTIVS